MAETFYLIVDLPHICLDYFEGIWSLVVISKDVFIKNWGGNVGGTLSKTPFSSALILADALLFTLRPSCLQGIP